MSKKTGLGLVVGAGLGVVVGAIGWVNLPIAIVVGAVAGLIVGGAISTKG